MTHPNKRIVHEQAHSEQTKRRQANEAILKKLTDYLNANPSVRFSQALSNLGIVKCDKNIDFTDWDNDYYTESEEILERMK